MQSSLKKSLYLGLAALSFASVASVTANSSNANAAKKHAAAKKVTYKTTNKDLDQSVTFKSTGKNAVYNKAVGKRSVVKNGSLDDMKSKVNSKSTKDLFMAYQEGVTSKGVHYYKVVSFDKKVRGFIYNKGVAKTNTTVAADKPANATGYLTQTDRFFNKAYGSQFKTSLKNDYKGMNIAADQFTVADAVKVNNDQTYYYVKDTKNELVNGWVNSVYFSNTITDNAKKATNSANAIHVNFVSDSNYGSVAFSRDLNPLNLSSTGVYNKSDVQNAVNTALIGTGYQLKNDISDSVSKGGTITVVVRDGNPVNLKTTNFKPVAINDLGNAAQSQTDMGDRLNSLKLTSDQWKQLFSGKTNQAFDFNNFESALLASGKAWNQFTDKDNNKTYTYDANLTKNSADNKALLNKDNSVLTFDDIANATNGFKIYYDVSNTNGQNSSNGQANSDMTQAQNDAMVAAQGKVKQAIKEYKASGLTGLTSNGYKDNLSQLLSDMDTSKLNNSQADGFDSLKDAAQKAVQAANVKTIADATVANYIPKAKADTTHFSGADGSMNADSQGSTANATAAKSVAKAAFEKALSDNSSVKNVKASDVKSYISSNTNNVKSGMVTGEFDALTNFDSSNVNN